MPMDVHKKSHFSLHVNGGEELLCIEDGGVEDSVGGFPSSVEVDAREGGAVVAEDDAVGVEHGD